MQQEARGCGKGEGVWQGCCNQTHNTNRLECDLRVLNATLFSLCNRYVARKPRSLPSHWGPPRYLARPRALDALSVLRRLFHIYARCPTFRHFVILTIPDWPGQDA